jgi:hypothetical protein
LNILSTYHEKTLRFWKVHEIKIKTKLCTQNNYNVYSIIRLLLINIPYQV